MSRPSPRVAAVVLLVVAGGLVGLHPWAVFGCTTAVITGKVTADGRPLLWKSRDTKSLPRNEVVVYEGDRHRVLAVVNDEDRDDVWMGVNSAGFCIENSLSRDLDVAGPQQGPGNGGIMKLALETCVTVADFQALLERTNDTGRRTDGNFGVIDAAGGAAMFEAGPRSFRMFDANDPAVAPLGSIVRSNFSTTAQGVAPAPAPDSLAVTYSGERYARACRLIDDRRGADLDVGYLLRRVCRDMADAAGNPFAGTVNGPAGDLPGSVNTSATISRTTTVSAGVFHGVKPGEDPLLTTMWVALGDPKFSIAVPCWVAVEELSDAVAGEKGGPLCSIATTLREWSLTPDKDGVETVNLRQIWDDVWPVEDRLISAVADMRRRSAAGRVSPAELTDLHRRLATQALDAMRDELHDMKQAALVLPAPPPPAFEPAASVPALAP
ncbi:MAG: peptidase C45 [Planctomycetaceae bacterium]